MVTCLSCAHENNDDAKFCEECGTKLEASLVREERKVITALFCDLVGSTAIGERLDAEDISHLLRDYQTICRRRIESHGGVVEKFIGDAVVGVFGVPLAHEDDPERGVRAALRITEDIAASELGIEVRIGVNTGEALVRLDVDPRSGEGFATGDTMNTAARLEASAPVMGVAVGAATHQASAKAIAYEELPSVSAKGKAEPVPAWRALQPMARVGTAERDRTSFVGRDLELSMLTQLFERSLTRPSTEFVTIVADPGLGKSRLVRELARLVDALPELVTWREGRCLPYGDGISFWALGEIVKAQAGILETDDQATVSTKLDQVMTESDPQTRSWIKDRLAPLVGLETSTEPPQQEEAFTAWRRFLEQIGGTGPTVLVIEDLHWADHAFVAFLEHLAERTAGLPLLVVVTARPEVEERHPSWPPGRRSTVLSLSPLMDQDLDSLITQSLPGAAPDLVRVVLERAGGSPLYAEQLAAMLRERTLPIGGSVLDESLIPSSVQALIAARIDALPVEPKRVLMEASVVGKTFWAGAISSMQDHPDLEATLAELVRREFCRPVHPSAMEGDLEFGFWHALVRDVAYAELTKAERARMHAAIARWIASRTVGAIGEDAEIVIHHVQSALDLAPSAGGLDTAPLTQLLTDALIEAGEAAMRTDVPRALPHLERALVSMEEEDARRPIVLALLGRALIDVGDSREVVRRLEEAVGWYTDRADTRAAASLSVPLADALTTVGQAERALDLLSRAQEMLEATPGQELIAVISARASHELADNHLDLAEGLAEEAMRLADSLGLAAPWRALRVRGAVRVIGKDPSGVVDLKLVVDGAMAAGDLAAASGALYFLAFYESHNDRSLEAYDDAIAFGTKHGLSTLGARVRRLGTLATAGRWDEVLEEGAALREVASTRGDSGSAWIVDYQSGMIRLERGESIGLQDALVAGARDHGFPFIYVAPLAAEAARLEGQPETARRVLEEALEVTGPHEIDMIAYFVLACLRSDAPDLARRALELGAAPDSMSDAEVLLAEAMLAEADGDLAAARSGFEQAESALDAIGFVPNRARALAGIGRCLIGLHNREAGVASLKQARDIWQGVGAVPRVADIDEQLATISVPDAAST